MILRDFPPMGVYETLFKFTDATGKYMGDPGTHPWAQGFPLTTQIPGGPPLPESIEFDSRDLKYPKATGEPPLLAAIADYYNHFYNAGISTDNIAVFAGGRPAIFATLAFLLDDTTVAVGETEYTPYYDILNVLGRKVHLIPSNEHNRFRPSADSYAIEPLPDTSRVFLLKSNPCNPTGVATGGEELRALVERFSTEKTGALIDEAYEFYCDPEPESALKHIDNIDDTNIFVIGAATKGLQVPGMRIGWAVASKKHIEIFRNYSSFGMGGVSRASQIYVTKLLQRERVTQARRAICKFYGEQRKRYGDGLADLGFELHTGTGGFYHWGKLPMGLTGDEFNERLFAHDAGILPGRLCDMARSDSARSSLDHFARFSFGPLSADSYDDDMRILREALN
ncbi:MAG: pyridoxal phosphate-dependent aminotransferase [Armatimonadetes bacterium]|nr:pyridoxal phosphate-dependent aminotransferase [Armatimonadota bacterium]